MEFVASGSPLGALAGMGGLRGLACLRQFCTGRGCPGSPDISGQGRQDEDGYDSTVKLCPAPYGYGYRGLEGAGPVCQCSPAMPREGRRCPGPRGASPDIVGKLPIGGDRSDASR